MNTHPTPRRLRVTAVFLIVGIVTTLSADEGPGNSAYHPVFTHPPHPLPLYEQLDAPLLVVELTDEGAPVDGDIHLWIPARGRDARFHTLWAYGAFLVSAARSVGTVEDVTILSEKGRPCVVQNPWPGCPVDLICDGKTTRTIAGDQLHFDTAPGDICNLVPKLPPQK